MDQNSQNIVLIKNRLTYLNFDAIFEFLRQFVLTCMYIFQEKCYDNFEIEHKSPNFWLGVVRP